tara:strand:+ start:1138 stop:1431 length:294 start_codon:yes stop_codon:yes gene_type:complete
MKFVSVAGYALSLPGIGVVEPGEEFECDKHDWSKQYNINRVGAPVVSARPTLDEILATPGTGALRELLSPYGIKGRSRKDLIAKACEAFQYPLPEGE